MVSTENAGNDANMQDVGTGSDSDEEEIDDEQLEEYKEMLEDLGTYPDKVKINSLSMVAEDHAESSRNAAAIYNLIRDSLISTNVHCDRKLPLVYLVDSILKNVKGRFVPIVENDAANWLPVVYRALPDDKRIKLEKVWNLWQNGVFSKDKWEAMGSCFSEKPTSSSTSDGNGTIDLTVGSDLKRGGLSFGKDGRLLMVPALREKMQELLDEMQQETSEMDKVSLERLAAVNTDLLLQIKEHAESLLRNGSGNNNGSSGGGNTLMPSSSKSTDGGLPMDDGLSFLVETRTPDVLDRSKAWEKANASENAKDARDVITSLHKLVRESTTIEKRYTRMEALEMTGTLATVSVTATLLANSLQQIKDESEKDKIKSTMGPTSNPGLNGMPRTIAPSYFTIDKTLFTNDGLKKLNEAVIGLLYEIGLPFVSSGDGRRFATQLELSKHMDALFRRGQLEKSIATTQERGWYDNDDTWSGGGKSQELGNKTEVNDEDAAGPMSGDSDADPDTFTEPADESRERCVICGRNFEMFFDNEDGIYKYKNCREIEVQGENSSEEMLVRVTCWRNLGSPDFITADQTLQDSL